MKDRWHPELEAATVMAPNAEMMAFEVGQRVWKVEASEKIMNRNARFQHAALRILDAINRGGKKSNSEITLFSYSYAAVELFRYARARGWRTILGQIDPGPEEERIVGEEHRRYPSFGSNRRAAPSLYWDLWRKEVELSDLIVVNSEWSRHCLTRYGIADQKMRVIPLVYQELGRANALEANTSTLGSPSAQSSVFRILFLGQINLRKGIARLIEAMRLLRGEEIELVLAGPTEVDPICWADLPNVRWVGAVPRSMVSQFYQQADVFILPTLSDGYALTQLEALAHGVPVIASKNCGNAVEHGMNGWILKDLQPATIAAAIRTARASMPITAAKIKEFDLDDLAESLTR